MKADEWLQTCLGPRLLLLCVAIQPMPAAMQRVLHLGSRGWEERQLHQACEHGGPGACRLLEAYHGRTLKGFFGNCNSLWDCAEIPPTIDPWALLPQAERTVDAASVAFATVARGAVAVTPLIRDMERGYPLKLFTLLENPAAADDIVQDRPCLYDGFTHKIRQRFRTAAELRSPDSLSLLGVVAVRTRLDTMR